LNNYNPEFWNDRFSTNEYVYGTKPNDFFKEQIDRLNPGIIFLPGEGEGRNAVYAATRGWKVEAIDQSSIGKNKADKLAESSGVKINYIISSVSDYIPQKNYYDAVAIIYFHIYPEQRKEFFPHIINALKPGGILIMEVFDKDQLGKTSGGPQNYDMLYSMEEVKKDFTGLKTILLKKEDIVLNESEKHQGIASVVRFVGSGE